MTSKRRSLAVATAFLFGALGVVSAAPAARSDAPGNVGITSFPNVIATGQPVNISGFVSGPGGPVAGIDVTVKLYTLPQCASNPAPVTVLTTGADGTFSFSDTLSVNPPVSYGFIVGLSQDPNRVPNFNNPDSCVTIPAAPTLSAQPEGNVTVNGQAFTGGVITYGSQVDLGKDSAIRLSTDAGTFRFYPTAGEGSSFIPVRVRLPKVKGQTKPRFLIEVRLTGGDFSSCPKSTKKNGFRTLSAQKPPPRSLWGHGKGTYRTKGRYSSATVSGTSWLVEDLCTGTLTIVRQGKVVVKDFATGKIVVVTTGHRYLARPR
jgi:hypothetical protein